MSMKLQADQLLTTDYTTMFAAPLVLNVCRPTGAALPVVRALVCEGRHGVL